MSPHRVFLLYQYFFAFATGYKPLTGNFKHFCTKLVKNILWCNFLLPAFVYKPTKFRIRLFDIAVFEERINRFIRFFKIMEYAERYIGWIIAIPLAASMPFIMDGIMVGATQSRIMRDSMIYSTIAYFAIFYTMRPLIGNNALWLAFSSYMFLRGVLQYFMAKRLQIVYKQAEGAAKAN